MVTGSETYAPCDRRETGHDCRRYPENCFWIPEYMPDIDKPERLARNMESHSKSLENRRAFLSRINR